MQASELQGGDQLPTRLADLQARLSKPERRRFNTTWRFVRQTLDVAHLVLREPRPGLETAEQFEELLGFAIWRLRLVRREIRRARLGA